MRDKAVTRDFYLNKLGFEDIGAADYPEYLIVKKDQIEIHFFLFKDLDPLENYGQVYIRTDNIIDWYELALEKNIRMPEAGHLHAKPWQQMEFSLLDPDHNLLTFGEPMDEPGGGF
jgi:hypothetical protein